MATIDKKALPYWIKTVLIFFLGWVVIYAGRSVPGPIMPQIQTVYGLSQSQLGLISSLFFLTYTLLQIPAGLLGDRLGRKRILVSGFMLFAVLIAAISLSTYYRHAVCQRGQAIAGRVTGGACGNKYGRSAINVAPFAYQ